MGEWEKIIDPIAAKFELAAMLDQQTVFNAKGSDAVAKLMRKMARTIDAEIVARNAAAIRNGGK